MTLPIFEKLAVGLPSTGQDFDASCISFHRGTKEDELLLIKCSDIDSSIDSEIWILNGQQQTWTQYDESPINIDLHTAALNQKKNTLWVHDHWNSVYKINLKDHKYETFHNVGYSGYDCQSGVIDNKFHVINARHREHLQWDDTHKYFEELSGPPLEVGFDVRHHCLISINETLLIIEGPTQSQFRLGINTLYRYDPTNCSHSNEEHSHDSWNVISLEVPIPLFCPKAVAVDTRFVLLFGEEFEYEIFVLDTYTMTHRESKVRIPDLGKCEVIISPRNDRKRELLVSGFIRNTRREMKCLPSCLIRLLATYYADDTAYLIGNKCALGGRVGNQLRRKGVLWETHRIEVDAIFECI